MMFLLGKQAMSYLVHGLACCGLRGVIADVVRRLRRTTCNAKEFFVASTVLFV
jgi:hypothetical protein